MTHQAQEVSGARKLGVGDKLQPGDFYVGSDGIERSIPGTFIGRDAGDAASYDAPLTFYRPVK